MKRSLLAAGIAAATILTVGILFVGVWASTGDGRAAGRSVVVRMIDGARDIAGMKRVMRRPVAVIIENSYQARPYLTGLKTSPLVFEMIVEGGISRFAVVIDGEEPHDVGPVRSLRPYLFEAALPYVTAVVHAGGSPEAFDLAARHSEVPALNLLSGSNSAAAERRHDIPAPHNLFTNAEGMASILPQENEAGTWPPFRVGSVARSATGAQTVTVNFGSSSHNVTFAYDMRKKRYTRENGDMLSDATPANVVILEAPITEIGELGRLTIPLEEGDGYVFRDGKMLEITWSKADPTEPFMLKNAAGSDVRLRSGQTWILVLADLSRVTWK